MTTTTYRYRTWRVTIGTMYLLVGAAFLFDTLGLFSVSPAVFWPLLLIALGVGMLLRRARRLQVEEDRSAQLAVAEERVRIARELHDVVAHGVSLMTIQISAARRVAATKPDSAEESLAAAEQAGRQTLNELNSMLGVLRGADASIGAAAWPGQTPEGETWIEDPSTGQPRSPLPKLGDVAELVDGLAKAGRPITLTVLGDPPQVPPSVGVVIYRVVQEALTNATRYAGDAPIAVELIYSPEAISIFVDDEGPGAAAQSRPGGGHGLVGMSERLLTVGGSLSAGPRTPGPGWRVHATVPIFALVP
jgi:signal transduction histidine kinase